MVRGELAFLLFLIQFGRHPHHFTKKPGEIVTVVDANFIADLINFHVCKIK